MFEFCPVFDKKFALDESQLSYSETKNYFYHFLAPWRVIYTEYLRVDRKEGHTVTKEWYIETLYNFCGAIKHKRPGLLSSRVIILHDKARAHTARITRAFLANFGWIIFTHRPYSLDLAPSDYYLFPLLKTWLGTQWFMSVADLETKMNT